MVTLGRKNWTFYVLLKNQRAYQWMLSKTHCPPLAWAVAAAGLGAVRRQRLNRQELDQALQAPLFPAPASDWSAPPLPEPTDVMASVILPAYNCAPYLRPCLDSVFAQQVDFKVQIIAVDDGSTDETPRILSVYRRENYEFFTLTDDGSAARARNAGLLRATGKYILFVDADDVLLPGALQALVDAAEAHHADVVQGGWRYLDLQGQPGLTQAYPAMEYRDRRRLSALDLPGTPWAKLYRRSLFQQIRFPANYTCFEDAIIHFLVFPSAQRILSIPQVVYGWRRTPGGITATSQGDARAAQAYWIAQDMTVRYDQLSLPRDALFACNLILQLCNFCYVCVASWPEDQKRALFAHCVRLYRQNRPSIGPPALCRHAGPPGAGNGGLRALAGAGKAVSTDRLVQKGENGSFA